MRKTTTALTVLAAFITQLQSSTAAKLIFPLSEYFLSRSGDGPLFWHDPNEWGIYVVDNKNALNWEC